LRGRCDRGSAQPLFRDQDLCRPAPGGASAGGGATIFQGRVPEADDGRRAFLARGLLFRGSLASVADDIRGEPGSVCLRLALERWRRVLTIMASAELTPTQY